MSPKTIIVLAMLAICTSVAAAVAVGLDSGARQDSRIGTAVFPNLADRANDVAAIILESNTGTLTLDRGAAGWTLRESDGYPVQAVRANGTVLDLASLLFHEQKTSQPEKHAKLNLLDFDAPGSSSSRVRIIDKNGAVLADLIVGNGKFNLPGTKTGGVYIRLPGDTQTWLAQGGVSLSGQESHWLEPSVFSIPGDRIKRVEIRNPVAQPVVIAKARAKPPAFALENMPPNFKLAYEDEPRLIATNLESLELEDARKAGTITFPPEKTTQTVFQTVEGLQIVVETMTEGNRPWTRFKFAATPQAASPVVEEAKSLATRTKGWVYRLADFRAARFTKTMPEMIEPAR